MDKLDNLIQDEAFRLSMLYRDIEIYLESIENNEEPRRRNE